MKLSLDSESGLRDRPALVALGALRNPIRLSALQMLVDHRIDGVTVAALAKANGLSGGTMSVHMAVLRRVKLAGFQRIGSLTLYRPGPVGIRALVSYVERGGGDAVDAPMDAVVRLLSPYRNPGPGGEGD